MLPQTMPSERAASPEDNLLIVQTKYAFAMKVASDVVTVLSDVTGVLSIFLRLPGVSDMQLFTVNVMVACRCPWKVLSSQRENILRLTVQDKSEKIFGHVVCNILDGGEWYSVVLLILQHQPSVKWYSVVIVKEIIYLSSVSSWLWGASWHLRLSNIYLLAVVSVVQPSLSALSSDLCCVYGLMCRHCSLNLWWAIYLFPIPVWHQVVSKGGTGWVEIPWHWQEM